MYMWADKEIMVLLLHTLYKQEADTTVEEMQDTEAVVAVVPQTLE